MTRTIEDWMDVRDRFVCRHGHRKNRSLLLAIADRVEMQPEWLDDPLWLIKLAYDESETDRRDHGASDFSDMVAADLLGFCYADRETLLQREWTWPDDVGAALRLLADGYDWTAVADMMEPQT